MEDLNKTEQVNVRLSKVQKDWLDEAAMVISRERGELVDPTTLARELVMGGVERIRAKAAAA